MTSPEVDEYPTRQQVVDRGLALVMFGHVLVWLVMATVDGWSWIGVAFVGAMGGTSAAVASILFARSREAR